MVSPSSSPPTTMMNSERQNPSRILPAIDTKELPSDWRARSSSSSASASANTHSMDTSASPTTSTSSKTAAFFGGSGGSTMRPPSMSISSGSSSHTSPTKATVREDGETQESLWSGNINRDGSWRGSQKGNRRWDNFEGKPVTPLPSPRIFEAEGQSRKAISSIFDIDFDQKGSTGDANNNTHHRQIGSSSRNSSRDRNLASFDISISDSFSSLPSLPSLGTIQSNAASTDTTFGHLPSSSSSSSSKTSSFFGTSRPPLPAPRLSNGGLPKSEDLPMNSPISPSSSMRRFPASSTRLFEPSRLPSMPLEHGIVPGTSASPPSAASTPTSRTPKPNFGYLPSVMEPEGSDERPLGAATPSTTSFPASGHSNSEDQSSDRLANESSSSSFHLSSFPSSPVSNRNQSRHVHGPSENASGSSFLPSAQAMHNAQDQQKNRQEATNEQQQQHMNPVPVETSPIFNAEESEDESENRVGRFYIERTLGVGAFSRVALAREKRSESSQRGEKESMGQDGLVALKMLEREPCMQNERMRVSWVREVEVLKHIVHPNIVRFLSSFSTPRHHNLVLEQVPGGELFDLLSNHHAELTKREWLVRILFGELANAVGWMHSINLVHRDIKLENILLTHQLFNTNNVSDLQPSTLPASPLLKISDFGLSRFVDPSSPLLETRCGSEEYAAPELIIGKKYDGRKTDVWAMGCVLYALLSGSLPFLSGGQEDQSQAAFSRGYSRERGIAEESALARKAHLLRIAKGDLRWPTQTNEGSLDQAEAPCPPAHRLITPLARRLVARLLRRDASKRATAWEAWDEAWLTSGSILDEVTAGTDAITISSDPRSEAGHTWLNRHARVQSGAPDLTHVD